MRIQGRCEHSRGFLRGSCGEPAIAECVYCGHRFCALHGERGPDFTDVCSRRVCRQKLRDVEEHIAWKRLAADSNRTSLCAEGECEERAQHICSRCRLGFCTEHVREQTIINRSVQPARRELALICTHCRSRRKLWS